MNEVVENPMRAWEAFYVIVGSSAGALTGLQFVVLTMISESQVIKGTEQSLAAFGSPNVVHFCAALLVSALFSAPWHGTGAPAIAALLCGAGGVLYSIAVLRRARRQSDYQPVLEDWVWHAILPTLAYAALAYAGLTLNSATETALNLVAGSALLLVFIGIHNAWDTVTYVVFERMRDEREKREQARRESARAVAPVSSPEQPTAPSPAAPDSKS